MTRTVPSPKLLVAGGAVVVASVAYAIGTSAGGGTAGAATKQLTPAQYSTIGTTGATGATGPKGGRHGFGRGAGFGPVLADAAKDLGVSEAKLRTALGELRSAFKGGKRDGDLVASLAKSLGISEAKVTEGLKAQRPARGAFGPGRHGHGFGPGGPRGTTGATGATGTPPAGAPKPPAGATGPSGPTGPAGGPRPGGRGFGPGGRGPGGPGFGGHGRFGPAADTAALAKSLGVTEAKLKSALETYRAAEKKERETLRKDLVAQLAKKLGVSEEKVTAVADKYLPKGFGRP